MTEPPANSAPPPKPRSGGSIALIVIGLLILVPSGLCSGFFGIAYLFEILGGGHPDDLERAIITTAVPLIGGVPFLIGVVLFILGLRMKPK